MRLSAGVGCGSGESMRAEHQPVAFDAAAPGAARRARRARRRRAIQVLPR